METTPRPHVTPVGPRRGQRAMGERASAPLLSSAVSHRSDALPPLCSVPQLDISLALRNDLRRYLIQPGRGSEWVCEIWTGDIRLVGIVADKAAALSCIDEYRQDIEHLLSLGWRLHT